MLFDTNYSKGKTRHRILPDIKDAPSLAVADNNIDTARNGHGSKKT